MVLIFVLGLEILKGIKPFFFVYICWLFYLMSLGSIVLLCEGRKPIGMRGILDGREVLAGVHYSTCLAPLCN